MHVESAQLDARNASQLLDGPCELPAFKREAKAAVAVVGERLPGTVLFKQDVGAQADASALSRFSVLAYPLDLSLRVEVHIGARVQGVKQPIAALDRSIENDFIGSEAALEGPCVLFIGNDFGITTFIAGHFQDPWKGVGFHGVGDVRVGRPVIRQGPAKVTEVLAQLGLVKHEAGSLEGSNIERKRHVYRPS